MTLPESASGGTYAPDHCGSYLKIILGPQNLLPVIISIAG